MDANLKFDKFHQSRIVYSLETTHKKFRHFERKKKKKCRFYMYSSESKIGPVTMHIFIKGFHVRVHAERSS